MNSPLQPTTTLSGGFLFALPTSHHKTVTYKGIKVRTKEILSKQPKHLEIGFQKRKDYENVVGPDTPKCIGQLWDKLKKKIQS
ncbi:hypothetical protein [Flagellimonas okinawensis]|uniref:Uncharacterized protein n=1 Tax=Flagellimonas okinawensis TaxID=3031324 RepID=A0ABT5XT31_9FLAO|nr:hypothetical protein [[Muricauda] okinawensis]MDF0709058.1 hypothetical protein [[Muricauda] okinawensis]